MRGWGIWREHTLLRQLPGRTAEEIHDQAQKKMGLRLPLRIPRQMVAVSALARNPSWGFSYYPTLRILKWDHAAIHRYGSRGKGVPYVAMGDADRAMKRWLRSEPVSVAADRMGEDPRVVWKWLLDRGLVRPSQRGNMRFFRHDPEFYDTIRSQVRGLETPVSRNSRPVRATFKGG